MADEILKIDANSKVVAGAITDDSNKFIRMLRIDDITKGLKVSVVGGGGTGTVTSISQGTGILLSPSPIVATGSVSLAASLQPIASLTGNSLKVLRVNVGETAVEYASVGAGTVTTVSVVTANGVSGSVATATTTPAITLTLGAITPSSVNSVAISGSSTPTLAVSGTTSVSGTNTGDQTSVTGNAGTATALQNARTIGGVSFNGTANITVSTATGGFTISGGDLALSTNNITLTGSIGATGARSTKGWFTNLEITNAPTINGVSSLATQTYTGVQTQPQVINTPNAITASGNAATVPITSKINNVTNNSAATLTITLTTASAVDGQVSIVRIYDFSAVAQTLVFVNTENSTVSVPTTSNGSTTLPLTVGFMYNTATSKWRCIDSV